MNRKNLLLIISLGLLLPATGFLQNNIVNVANDENAVWRTIDVLTNLVFTALLVLAVFLILGGAFTLLTSAGDEGKIKTGRNYIMYAIVGIAVAFIAKALVNLVKRQLGI